MRGQRPGVSDVTGQTHEKCVTTSAAPELHVMSHATSRITPGVTLHIPSVVRPNVIPHLTPQVTLHVTPVGYVHSLSHVTQHACGV